MNNFEPLVSSYSILDPYKTNRPKMSSSGKFKSYISIWRKSKFEFNALLTSSHAKELFRFWMLPSFTSEAAEVNFDSRQIYIWLTRNTKFISILFNFENEMVSLKKHIFHSQLTNHDWRRALSLKVLDLLVSSINISNWFLT